MFSPTSTSRILPQSSRSPQSPRSTPQPPHALQTPLSQLSDRDLDGNLGRLVCHERAHLVDILNHINEVDLRRLHRALGFSSIFSYCVTRLKYSHSAAGRRIAAARALRLTPDVGSMLAGGDLSLTTLSMVACILTPANQCELLARIRCKSEAEVKGVVAEFRPEPPRRDRIRPVCLRGPVSSAPCASASDSLQLTVPVQRTDETKDLGATTTRGQEVAQNSPDETSLGRPGAVDTPGAGSDLPNVGPGKQPATPRVVRKNEIRFLADNAFLEKLEEMKSLLSNRAAAMTLEQVFAAAMDAFLETHCPARRHKRRVKRSRKQPVAHSLPAPGVRRHVPIAVRDAVHARDGGRCTFVGRNGTRCDARRNLQVDHIRPFALGGSHEPGNLRLLCRAHNLLAAERAYGREAMAGHSHRE